MGKKQPELYRIPRKPGYLGGYNWRATTLGCLLLLVVNFVATQYIAARFQYQAALGAPILRAKSGSVYQPFSWIAWGWRYCTSQDERIRRPFFEGEMIVFAGSFLCIGIFFALANRRARRRSRRTGSCPRKRSSRPRKMADESAHLATCNTAIPKRSRRTVGRCRLTSLAESAHRARAGSGSGPRCTAWR